MSYIPVDGVVLLDPETLLPVYITGSGQLLGNCHDEEDCALPDRCVIHNPTEHSMRSFKTHWRNGGLFDIKPAHMERICSHGIGHPDPDDVAFWHSRGENVSVHGCDGCCSENSPKS